MKRQSGSMGWMGMVVLLCSAPVFPQGYELNVDKDLTLTGTVRVSGIKVASGAVLTLNPQENVTVITNKNFLVEGSLVSKPSGPGVVHTIRFEGPAPTVFQGGDGLAVMDSDVGLWVMGSGRLDLAGSPRTTWANLQGGATAGSNTLVLAAPPMGWRAGDKLVITPTEPISVSGFSTHFDEVEIASVAGNTVTLTAPLRFNHPMVDGRFAAEVMNISKNMLIESAPAAIPKSSLQSGTAHILIHSGSPQNLSNVEIRRMGVRRPTSEGFTAEVRNRAALLFLQCGDGSRKSRVDNVAAHHLANSAFVLSGSHGILVNQSAAFDVYGIGYDVGNTTNSPAATHDSHDLTVQGSIASMLRFDPAFRGYRLSAFSLGDGERNRILSNVVAGVQGTTDASGYHWTEGADGVFEFSDCVSHNNARHGIFTWQNVKRDHLVEKFVAYRNGGSGLSHGAYNNIYRYRNMELLENDIGITHHAQSHEGTSLKYTNMRIQGGRYAILSVEHVGGTGFPTLFGDIRCSGQSGKAVVFESTEGAREQTDLVRVVANPQEVEVRGMPVGSVVRIQSTDDKTAWEMDHLGNTKVIPIFAPINSGDITPPSAPPGFSVQPAGNNDFRLSWSPSTDPESGIRHYNIYRDKAWVSSQAGTTFLDDYYFAFRYLSTHEYRISAVNGNQIEGPFSRTYAVDSKGNVREVLPADSVVRIFADRYAAWPPRSQALYRRKPGQLLVDPRGWLPGPLPILEILDLSGRTRFKSSGSEMGLEGFTLDVRNYPPGKYLFRMRSGTRSQSAWLDIEP